LDIAGSFIYNGLKTFDEMENLYYEDTIFEFLYQISVGIERLEKIAIILIEHDNKKDQKELEKNLKTHNHLELLRRIKNTHNIGFEKKHNSFVEVLTNFYKHMRYDRYSLASVDSFDKEKNALVDYINKYSEIKITNDFPSKITQNNKEIKFFIGNIVKKIVLCMYQIIKDESIKQNIFTYEIRGGSKAEKIFSRKEFDFVSESILWKELLIYILNNKEKSGVIDFIKDIDPLMFDPVLISDYLSCFKNDLEKLKFFDELESYQEDVDNLQERINILELLDIKGVFFDDIEE